MDWNFFGIIENCTGFNPFIQGKIIASLVLLIAAWIIQKIAQSILTKKIQDLKFRYKWIKTISYTTYILVSIIIAGLWFEGIRNITTFLGLVSAGLAVAMKEPLANLAGWAFILWRKPFEVGDRIQLGEYKGDVIDQRLFMFTLFEVGNWVQEEQSTGRLINVPNGLVFTQVLANYNKGFEYIWNELTVHLTFESNWQKADKILTKIAEDNSLHLTEKAKKSLKKSAEKMMIFYNKLTPKIYLSVEDRGILLTIRYLCEIKQRRGSAEAIWKDILTEFAKHEDIKFAYPTQRVFFRPEEQNGELT